MFWGIILEPGKRYSQMVDSPFHVSMASLECNYEDKQKVEVMVEHQNAEYMLCSLIPDKLPQQQLDLNFEEGEEITLFINGYGTVHLTGYLLEANEATDVSDLDLEEMESEEEEEEQVSIKNKRKAVPDLKPAKKMKQSFTVNEDEDSDLDTSDDDEDVEEFLTEKKTLKKDNKDVNNAFPQKGDKSLNTPNKQNINKQNNSILNKASAMKNKPKPQMAVSNSDNEEDDSEDINDIPSTQKKQQKQSAKSFSVTPQAENKMGKTPQSNKVKQTNLENKANDTINSSQVSVDGSASEKKKKKKKKKKQKNLNASEVSNESVTKTPEAKKIVPNTPKSSQKLPGGTAIEDITVGSGPVAKKGKVVQLNYVGKLKNNQIFDQSKKFPFRFRLGANEVIPGMDQGVEGMKVGGKRKIIVPPHKGYGNKATGSIPANSTLIFEVELKSVS